MFYFLWIHFNLSVDKGAFNEVNLFLENFSKIAEDYEYKQAEKYQLLDEQRVFAQQRALNDARNASEKYELSFKFSSDAMTITFLGAKAIIQTLLNDYDAAEKSLRQAEETSREQAIIIPFVAQIGLIAGFYLNIRLLEESILSNNESMISMYRKQAR